MLGIRLTSAVEVALERHARAVGRSKSGCARDWITQGLERDSIDEQMRVAAGVVASEDVQVKLDDAALGAWCRWLDAEDGGYDWGPEGPPG